MRPLRLLLAFILAAGPAIPVQAAFQPEPLPPVASPVGAAPASGVAGASLAAPETSQGLQLSLPVPQILLDSVVGSGTELPVGRRRSAAPAGLAPHQSGVYVDPVAWKLRGRTGKEVEGFLRESLKAMPDSADRRSLADLVEGRTFGGAAVALAYGVGLGDVKPQFHRYLRGLADQAGKDASSFVVVTPSSVEIDDIKDYGLLDRLRFHGKGVLPDPEQAEPGHVHILRTGTLPHPIFVGLMAYSQAPPVLAGDGALSAALALGRPFVMTRIDWNGANVDELRKALSAEPRTKTETSSTKSSRRCAWSTSYSSTRWESISGPCPGASPASRTASWTPPSRSAPRATAPSRWRRSSRPWGTRSWPGT